MKLDSKTALKMLEEAKGKSPDDGWIYHSICVGNTAGKIADALNLDADKAKTLGFIHDLGKLVGDFRLHVTNGYFYLKDLGYDEEYANICLTHSFLNNDIKCVAERLPDVDSFLENFIKSHEYTIYEKIINLCDLMCTSVNLTVEKRLVDILIRKGVYENTVYHLKEAQKLKAEFDKMLGYNLYSLFPDVIDN